MSEQHLENEAIIKRKKGKKKGCLIFILIFVALSILLGLLNNFGLLKPENNNETIKTGKDYETLVFQAFWEGASDFFGVEYSDYKMTQTAYGLISENTTTDGYTSYYYLIQTAYESQNAFGTKVLHKVTARCYYVPEHSNTVYTTYITQDGEKVYFDEEKENWLLGIES